VSICVIRDIPVFHYQYLDQIRNEMENFNIFVFYAVPNAKS